MDKLKGPAQVVGLYTWHRLAAPASPRCQQIVYTKTMTESPGMSVSRTTPHIGVLPGPLWGEWGARASGGGERGSWVAQGSSMLAVL